MRLHSAFADSTFSTPHAAASACAESTFFKPRSPLLLVQAAVQVGQKRVRDDESCDAPVPKKVRQGQPAKQWITVYNKHPAMDQR